MMRGEPHMIRGRGRLGQGREMLRRLGEDVAARRKALHLSVDELAGRAGISRRALVYLESGTRNPGWLNVVAVWSALNLSVVVRPKGHGVGEQSEEAAG